MNQPARHLRRPEAPPRPAPDAPRHLRVVGAPPPTAAQRRRRARLMVVSGMAVAVSVMFALVYLHVVLAQRQIELDHLSTVATARQTAYQQLRLRVAELESPAQIISVAEGRLGMRQPASVTYLSPPASAPAASASAPSTGAVATVAPAGDADWPTVKAELAGRP